MKVLWLCGLPDVVRREALDVPLTDRAAPAWSWVVGHLPPPKDVELHFICPVMGLRSARVDFEYMGAQWHCFRQDRLEIAFLWLRFYLKIRSFVKRLYPDVIHGWGGETGCGWLATWLSRRSVVSVQGLLVLFRQLMEARGIRQRRGLRTYLSLFCERNTYKRAGVLLVESEASGRGLRTLYGRDGIYVPHPLRADFLRSDLMSSRLGLIQNNIVEFVYIGELTSRKGALDAVKAFSMVSHGNTRLVMIGTGVDQDNIQSFVSKNALTDRIILRGNVPSGEIINEFTTAQFFLLPSYADTGPTALKEALACGLYPIVYANSGPQDLVSHYGCGTLVKTGNVEELTSAMEKCIADIADCVKSASSAALKVREELSKENVWSRLKQVYASVLSVK